MEVAVIIAGFKESLKIRGYAEKTVSHYGAFLFPFAAFLAEAGITDLRSVTRETLRQYQAVVLEKPCAVETRAIHIRAVKRLFEYLMEANRLLVNPAEGLKERHGSRRALGVVLTVAEVERLLNQPNLSLATGLRDRAVLEVLYSTGLRVGELAKLTVHDVDLKDKVLFVRKGKGGKDRVAPLGAGALRYVREYLENIRPRHAKKKPTERALFLTHSGEPLTGNTIQAALRECRKKAGIKKPVSPHALRRSCATHLLAGGADVRHVQQLLGHRRIKTTQRYTLVLAAEVKKTHNLTHPGVKMKEKAP